MRAAITVYTVHGHIICGDNRWAIQWETRFHQCLGGAYLVKTSEPETGRHSPGIAARQILATACSTQMMIRNHTRHQLEKLVNRLGHVTLLPTKSVCGTNLTIHHKPVDNCEYKFTETPQVPENHLRLVCRFSIRD